MRSAFYTRIAAASCLLSCVVTGPLAAQTELNGAWEIVEASGHNFFGVQGEFVGENIQPSLYIFMDGYYSIMLVAGNESRPLMAEDANRESITEEEMSSIFMPFIANSGTYEVNGSTLTTRPMVALWPNFMEGGSAVYEYRVEDGVLMLSSGGEDWSWKAKLRRLR